MAYFSATAPIGHQPIANTETTAKHALGTLITATDPTYGNAEFIYMLGVGSTVVGSLVTYNATTWQTTLTPTDTSGNGKPVAVAMSANVASQYGWYQVSGLAVIKKTAVAVTPQVAVFVSGTAGRIYVTDSAGKQILGAQSANLATIASGTSTVTVSINRPFIER